MVEQIASNNTISGLKNWLKGIGKGHFVYAHKKLIFGR